MELSIHITPTYDNKGLNFYITKDFHSVFSCTIPNEELDGIHKGVVKTLSQEHIARYLTDYSVNMDLNLDKGKHVPF